MNQMRIRAGFYTTANMKKCVKTAYDIQKERFSNEKYRI